MNEIKYAPTAFGRPEIDMQDDFVRQSYDNNCAVRAQELILRDFGKIVTEDGLCNQAIKNGWYDPDGGTQIGHVGNLLEANGIAVNRFQEANIFNIANELAQGHKIIAGVDANELWRPGFWETMKDLLGFESPNHALLVSGIDTSDPDNIKVVLTDPGTGDVARAYPMAQFLDAWRDSGCFMVSTVEAAPIYLPEMANFNYSLGHIENVGHMPFEQFHTQYQCYFSVPYRRIEHHLYDEFIQQSLGAAVDSPLETARETELANDPHAQDDCAVTDTATLHQNDQFSSGEAEDLSLDE